MLIGEIILVALAAIRANKLRSLLTMLGIVIGVAAVITMVALGSGAQKSVQDQIERLGTDLLSVYPGQSFMRGVASGERVSLTMDDADALERAKRVIAEVVPEMSSNRQVKLGNTNINVSIVGTTPNYTEVNNYEIDAGRMFTTGDDNARRRVAVVGGGVPNQLSVNGPAMIGQTISIGGIPFEVVGLVQSKGSQGGGWDNPDERVLIPLSTARYRVFGNNRLRSITVQVAEEDSINIAMLEIEGALRTEHGIRPGEGNDFQIRNRSEFLATFEETTRTFTFLLAGIAAVSLLVGGIGIMNIMLVSVTERTREIGVRKALGATRHSILLQFMVEALVLCLMGGIMGILLGSGGAIALSRLANWNTLISLPAVFLAIAFSVAVGLFFGIWPAQRAARLDPVEALRYE
jgi:putative ABC transport system permease protein